MPHAEELGCAEELSLVSKLVEHPSAARQRALAGEDDDHRHLVSCLSDAFAPEPAGVSPSPSPWPAATA